MNPFYPYAAPAACNALHTRVRLVARHPGDYHVRPIIPAIYRGVFSFLCDILNCIHTKYKIQIQNVFPATCTRSWVQWTIWSRSAKGSRYPPLSSLLNLRQGKSDMVEHHEYGILKEWDYQKVISVSVLTRITRKGLSEQVRSMQIQKCSSF
jgi:hypothetical protein